MWMFPPKLVLLCGLVLPRRLCLISIPLYKRDLFLRSLAVIHFILMVVPVKIEPFFEDLLKETGHIDFSVLPVEEIRRLRGAAFTSEEGLPKVLEEDKMVQRQNGKTVEITITRPPNTENKVLPIIFYM